MLGTDTETEDDVPPDTTIHNCSDPDADTHVRRHEFRIVLPDPKKLAILGVVALEAVALHIGVAPATESRLMAFVALVGIGAYSAYLHEIDKRQKHVDQRVDEAREAGRREAAYSEWIARMEADERDSRNEVSDAVDSCAEDGDDDE